MSTTETNQSHFITNYFMGGISGSLSKTLMAPFERSSLIFRFQLSNPSPPYTSTWDCMRRIIKEEGATYLWRGNIHNARSIFPTQALNFAFRDFFTHKIQPASTTFSSSLIQYMMVGGLSGACATCFTYPSFYTVRRGPIDMSRMNLPKQPLISRLISDLKYRYKGFGGALPYVVTYRALYFGLYDATMREILQEKKDGLGLLGLRFGVAYGSTLMAHLLSIPFHIVPFRMNIQEEQTRKYRNSWHCLSRIIKEEGIGAVFKGGFRGVTSVTSALILVLYDQLKDILNDISKHN